MCLPLSVTRHRRVPAADRRPCFARHTAESERTAMITPTTTPDSSVSCYEAFHQWACLLLALDPPRQHHRPETAPGQHPASTIATLFDGMRRRGDDPRVPVARRRLRLGRLQPPRQRDTRPRRPAAICAPRGALVDRYLPSRILPARSGRPGARPTSPPAVMPQHPCSLPAQAATGRGKRPMSGSTALRPASMCPDSSTQTRRSEGG